MTMWVLARDYQPSLKEASKLKVTDRWRMKAGLSFLSKGRSFEAAERSKVEISLHFCQFRVATM
uniref:Uncharacterized protein n=1 Tax=Manihot esculenta TaxID=3983 RepID=A0A2C9UU29_MANES